MFQAVLSSTWNGLRAIKPPFVSKKPHFSFITAHYFWIIGATIVGSILFYAAGRGSLAYIDALLFASGSNTQAGLNPVDVNTLNTFQQTLIYFFALTSNPITLHGCVVFLRLYWFEKRFQGWVREVRNRRPTFTKSKGKSFGDVNRMEQGVNGRHITVVPRNGKSPRMTNDGIILEERSRSNAIDDTETSASSTITDDMPNATQSSATQVAEDSDDVPSSASSQPAQETAEDAGKAETAGPGHTAIKFAETVKRSDGLEDDVTKLPPRRANAEHIAILERQRNEDADEVLRIPGPRDAERGLMPTRVDDDVHKDDDDPKLAHRLKTTDSNPDHKLRDRQPTITIAEPERGFVDDLADEAKVWGSTLSSIRFRKPRLFNRKQNKHHEDNEDDDDHHDPRDSGDRQTLRVRTLTRIRTALSQSKDQDMPYLSYNPTIGRNSNFVGLTLEQREELGGIEYRALRTLAIVLLVYFWGFQLIGLSCLLPYILHQQEYGEIVEAAGVSRTWWGFFTANVSFMDVGFTLTPDSMISFVKSEFVLMIMCIWIIIGNTGFPVMLRFLIWVMTKLVPRGSGIWEELRFLLDHPRRCFTLLFPSGANWWLFGILILLNSVDLLFFMVLDLKAEPISDLPVHNRVVVGLFQSASTRTAGFSAVNLGDLHPAMPVFYMIMMYISVFPIAISIRRTNVYEEKSLGVYDTGEEDDEAADANALSYVGTHLRRQLSFDLWFVFLGFFILAICEGSKISEGRFDLFSVLFETVSAYGTVGLSMGAKGVNASLCSQFTTVGKLVIVAMQIRGRHRGLPYGLDRAVLLPSEARFKKEAEEAEAALARMNTAVSTATASGMQRTHSFAIRRRSMSREKERPNSHILTQLLHPGPVPQRDPVVSRARSRSIDHGNLLEPLRTLTEPIAEEPDTALEQMPSSTSSRMRPRRADTSPTLERNPWRQAQQQLATELEP
ncbi:hypothetical protein VHEMI05272 [[Torrubiella] hemipterigena]|uniref:Potassium transport protein n=1 Tax=[Torrubiella] hemipterigena TaxID=1531966 RepID=A0A0A1T3L1_9HYPO|nr:hypothetical protein VHEMI05272 [[Torrubiella] hemipterigena]